MSLRHYGNKVKENGITFDSQKEYNFYKRFLENSDYDVSIHEKFDLVEKNTINNKITIRSITYRPDFVVRDSNGKILHVLDVKNSFGNYGVDRGANLVFKLFAKRYSIPVEVVVPLKNSFKTKILGTTKRYDVRVHSDINYDWRKEDV